MGYHQRTLFAVISVLCMLISRPATVQSVSCGAPRSLIVNGVEALLPQPSPSQCTIVNGKKVCNPPIPGRKSRGIPANPRSREP
ncbi:hypothetical protein MUK42_29027 [Musa troglodytarum]|uniref:Uncharacterized protein n=1 Tax=Musa troglodytarum TaxID=320322 RepID=A0A9E7JXQ7_9LILI|nr:hypothetical protein MUK42_29027 [Musa troglodytarum]